MTLSTKHASLLACAALAGGLGLAGTASALSMTDLAQGYALAAQAVPKADAKAAEGKCGEGKCGADKAASHAADKKPAEGKCGEGKCGADKSKAKPAPAAKKAAEGKCGEGKCGAGH
ncbi:HvfA family oxazolone/thioamide-modified RiPP metallophore [Stenotrophomonas bentonitica]|jgi:uncharacterized low-complexity protein